LIERVKDVVWIACEFLGFAKFSLQKEKRNEKISKNEKTPHNQFFVFFRILFFSIFQRIRFSETRDFQDFFEVLFHKEERETLRVIFFKNCFRGKKSIQISSSEFFQTLENVKDRSECSNPQLIF